MFSVSDEPWCAVAVDSNNVETDWGLCDMTTDCKIDSGGKSLNIINSVLLYHRVNAQNIKAHILCHFFLFQPVRKVISNARIDIA